MNNKNIESGDNSNNLQAKQITVNNYYTSEANIKKLAVEVFKDNMPRLSAMAHEILFERVETIVNKIINSAIDADKNILNNFQEPGIQLSLLEVQKGYAKSGDNHLLEILTKLFIERLKDRENSLNSIVMDEAIRVAPKLTVSQMNVLAFIYRFNYIINDGLKNYQDVFWFAKHKLLPVSSPIPRNDLQFKHMAYTGTVLFSNGIRDGRGLTNGIFNKYSGALQKGYKLSEIPEDIQKGCLSISIHDESKDIFRFVGQNLKIVENNLLKNGFDRSYAIKVSNFLYTKIISPYELGDKLRRDLPEYKLAMDNWDIIDLQNMSLSSVGAILAETFLITKNMESNKIVNNQFLED